MKSLLNKGLVVFAVAAIVTTLSVDSAFAQRPSRGGGGGGGRSSSIGPSRSGGSRQPSMQAPSGNRISQAPNRGGNPSFGARPQRPGYRPNIGVRPGVGYRPNYGYRPGGGYRYGRAYYGYYNYYRPFIGFRLNVLPFGYYPFYYGPDQYYYSGGLFYRQYENNYQVVVPPVGAEVPKIGRAHV